MNYKDVALLNGSIDQLGESLLKNRMLEQQAAEKQQQFGIEQGRTAVAQSQADATKQHWSSMEAGQTAATADKAKANANRTWNDTVKMFGGWVKDGVVDPQVAQDKLSQAYAGMPDPAKQALADHPAVQAIQDGKPIWKAPPAKEFRPPNDPAAVSTEKAAQALKDEASKIQETDPEGAKEKLVRAEVLLGTIKKNPPRPANDPAAVATLKAAKDMRDQATAMGEEDPAGAKQLNSYADLLEGHIRKTPAAAPVLRKSVTTKQGSSGNATTISGPADQVDASLKTVTKPLPLPSNKAQMVKGQAYTAQGQVWTWDGAKLVK